MTSFSYSRPSEKELEELDRAMIKSYLTEIMKEVGMGNLTDYPHLLSATHDLQKLVKRLAKRNELKKTSLP